MSTLGQFGSTKVQYACVEAPFSISNPLDATPSDTALLLSSFCDELDYEGRWKGGLCIPQSLGSVGRLRQAPQRGAVASRQQLLSRPRRFGSC